MPPFLVQWSDAWASVYSNSALLRTGLGFAHIAGLVVSAGSALVVDRATLRAWRSDAGGRLAHARAFDATHRVVLWALAVVSASGILLLAADVETYLYSKVFWAKMAAIVVLVVNGGLLMRAGRQAAEGRDAAWLVLRYGSMASVVLWLLATLMGAALPNV